MLAGVITSTFILRDHLLCPDSEPVRWKEVKQRKTCQKPTRCPETEIWNLFLNHFISIVISIVFNIEGSNERMIKDSPRSAPNIDIHNLFVHQVLIRLLILIGSPINKQVPIVTIVIKPPMIG